MRKSFAGKSFAGNTVSVVALSLFLGVVAFGCLGAGVKKESAADSKGTTVAAGVSNKYYDFPDVLIPGDLELVPKGSSIYQTPGFSAGMMILEGYVDAKSLSSFFEGNMAKDNWRYLSSIKFNPYLMLFIKDGRACVIRIEESSFKTKVEVWVGPTPSDKI